MRVLRLFLFCTILAVYGSSCAVISFDKVKGAQDRTDSLKNQITSYRKELVVVNDKIKALERDTIKLQRKNQQMESKIREYQAQFENYKSDAPSQVNLLLDDLEEREVVLQSYSELADKRSDLLKSLYQEIQGYVNGADTKLIKTDITGTAIEIQFTDTALFNVKESGVVELRKDLMPLLVKIADRIRKNSDVFSEIIGHVDFQKKSSQNDWQRASINASILTDYLVEKALIPTNAIEVISMGSTEPIASNEFPPGQRLNRRVIWKIYAYRKGIEKVLESLE